VAASSAASGLIAGPLAIRPLLISLVLVTLGGWVDVVFHRSLTSSSWPREAEGGQTGGTRTVQARTSTGRQGTYFLPRDYETRALPLMVGFHGTAGKGSLMVLRLQALAEREGFIVLAPDSVSVPGVWVVGQRPDEVTEDYRHVMDCVREVLQVPGVRVDRAHVLAAGFSVGGSVAPYIASHEDLFNAFAVLHGHVTPGAMGPRRPRGWVSAGDRDRVRTVEYMKSVADHLRRHEGFTDVEQRVFHVDHSLGDEELAALVAWWLRREGSR
jgi:poly(3-hydroxybutyrate) depolymerase